MKKYSSVLLCILDGFGLNPRKEANAVYLANTPNFDSIFKTFPHTTLITCGLKVGLPEGQMGNSEVGHTNIGAGRVVKQWLVKITDLLNEGYLEKSPVVNSFLHRLGADSAVHLVGLFSDGGIHSHLNHSLKLSEFLTKKNIKHYFHIITDGRDTSPTSGIKFVENLSKYLLNNPLAEIATVSGRFYAMDRDKRWQRTYQAYQAIYLGESPYSFSTAEEGIKSSYERNVTDEFIEPFVVNNYSGIKKEDGIIFFNFREDRMRQIVSLILNKAENTGLPSITPHSPDLVLTFTNYDRRLPLNFIFEEERVSKTLGEVISKKGLSQLRISETEKYPHVTYFFNCGREEPYQNEERIHIPSPRDVKTYDQKPEMSAYEVTEEVVAAIKKRKFSLIVLNFANPDMVGHTGVLSAAIKAVETVDTCLGRVLKACQESETAALIFADHGNAEQMIDYETGKPHTAHTKYPVPFVLVSDNHKLRLREGGTLANIAPTALMLLDIEKPLEMTEESLILQ